MKIPLLSQLDPRWSQTPLGDSPYRVGRWGCVVTSLSMASAYFNCFKLPDALAKELSFTKDGLIIWNSIPSVLNFKLHKRFYGAQHDEITNGLKDPKKCVLLQVNNAHWMLAWGRDWWNGTHYRCADPLRADIVSTRRYGTITGGAVLIKP